MIRLTRVRSVRIWFASAMALVLLAAMALMGGLAAGPAAAAQAAVPLGATTPFAVLAGSTVTNTGSSVLTGDLGLSPGSAVTGFPPGTYTGTENIDDTPANDAQDDLTLAADAAASATPTNSVNYSQLGGLTLTPGVYNATSSMALTGTVTLSGNGVYIFQAGTSLTTASSSTVLLDGAQAGCVFWQVGSSATLGTATDFSGTIIAATAVTLDTGASVIGRVLAQTAAVTLDDNVITVPASCVAAAGVSSTTTTGLISDATGIAPTGTEVTGASFHDTATVSGASGIPTGTVTYSLFDNGTCVGTAAVIQAPVTISLVGAVPNSASTGALAAGSYSFDATYSGDTTYTGGTSACEPFSVLAPVITPPVTPPTTPTTPPVTTPPVTTPPVTTPPVTAAPVTPAPVTPAPTTPAATTGSAASPAASSGTSSTAGTGSTTASPSVVLPVGGAQTGLGGAARSGDNMLMIALSAAALLGAVAATGLALRRRRVPVTPSHTSIDEV